MPDWLIPLGIGVLIVGLVGAIWRAHENHDRERIDDVWNQIGRSSEEGMRKVVHESVNRVYEMVLAHREAERRIARIERVLNGKLKHEDDR